MKYNLDKFLMAIFVVIIMYGVFGGEFKKYFHKEYDISFLKSLISEKTNKVADTYTYVSDYEILNKYKAKVNYLNKDVLLPCDGIIHCVFNDTICIDTIYGEIKIYDYDVSNVYIYQEVYPNQKICSANDYIIIECDMLLDLLTDFRIIDNV